MNATTVSGSMDGRPIYYQLNRVGNLAVARREFRRPAGDALRTVAGGVVVVDTDADGIPDEWERAQGLDPGAQDHDGLTLSERFTGVGGYTNLECYLNDLADRRGGRVR